MPSHYPGRIDTLNKQKMVHVRLDDSQKERLEEYAKRYNSSISDIIREAITIWLNLNAKGGK
jgi:predicted transcriptional regulator